MPLAGASIRFVLVPIYVLGGGCACFLPLGRLGLFLLWCLLGYLSVSPVCLLVMGVVI